MFIVYSYMFRLTRVIFRLELYLFAMSLCSLWDPRRLHVINIDLCGLVVRVSGYRYRGPGFDSRRYQIF
jgi:hypothetical protein